MADLEGHGLTFTVGRGNELCVAAIESMRHLVVGKRLDDITADFAGFWRSLASESQLRWLGPEKGVIHLALAAIVNAVWDLYAKAERKPLWKLLADMTPAQIVSAIDFRYITDALTPDEALAILERQAATKADREAQLLKIGYPAYTTSAGWIGYSEDGIRKLVTRGAGGGLDAFQGQGRRRAGGRRTPGRPGARSDRPEPDADDRCEPELERGRGDRAGQRAGEVQAVVDRGADQPGRRARACRDRERRPAGRCWRGDRRALRESHHLQTAAPGQRDRFLPDRQLPAGRGQREPGRDSDGGQVRRAGLSRMPAASVSASTCSTCRCSTTSR